VVAHVGDGFPALAWSDRQTPGEAHEGAVTVAAVRAAAAFLQQESVDVGGVLGAVGLGRGHRKQLALTAPERCRPVRK
jgi:hypothetical protein